MKINFNQAIFITSYGMASQITKSDNPEFVFCGHSNVGKSSLINKLFSQKKLARVSSVPGKTATINLYSASQIGFVDLPGYGYAKVSKDERKRWDDLILGYFNGNRDIVLTFILLDVRHKPANEDLTMLNFLIESEIPFVVVVTKCDKLSNNQLKNRLEEIKKEIPSGDDITILPFSAENGLGVLELRKIIEEAI